MIFQHKSSILNDESGSGKCFQCIALFDAILRTSDTKRILIICQRRQSLEHWQYHTDCFLRNVNTKIADNESDIKQDKACTEAITIASLDYVLTHFPAFKTIKFDCLVLQDQYAQMALDIFERLKHIRTKCKIFLCSDDLMVRIMRFDRSTL